MTLLLLNGFDYDPCEMGRHATAKVFKTWRGVETHLQATIDDARSVLTSYLDGDKIQFTETLYRRNGNPVGYVCKLCLDMADPKHRKAYMDIISDNWLSAEDYQWSENINSHTRELTVVNLWVEEVEI